MKVNMPSGGYLFIQQTEALTVIDVNSGKFVSSATQDETILKTNLEAVHEIARQLRLRNIGGMIIIDFIDMTSRVDKLAIMEELELAIESDKAKPQVGQLSDLGLVEMTRHRQGQSISEVFAKKCPHCHGEGFIVEEFKFASPVAEGEYRAKAAKMKLPVSGFKKNNNKFQNNNGQNNENQTQPKVSVQEQQAEQLPVITENPSVEAVKETKKRGRKKGSTKKELNKQDIEEKSTIEVAETMITPKDEIVPVINKPVEIEQVEETVSDKKVETQTEEKPKKSRRPNRGGAKQKRQTKGKKVKEENFEEN